MSHGNVNLQEAKGWLGKDIVAYKKDGSISTGKLVRIQGNKLYLKDKSNKKVRTSAILPLALFDLLAIGGGYGGGYGGYYGGAYGYGPGFGYGPGYGAGVYPYGGGYPGLFW